MIFDRWFKSSYGPKNEMQDEASVENAWKKHADALSEKFHKTVSDTDDRRAVEAFFRDAEKTVSAESPLSPKDMELFIAKLRTRLLNEWVLTRNYDDVLAEARQDAQNKSATHITDPNVDAFGPYPDTTISPDPATAQAQEEQRIRERREQNLAAMNAAYDAVEARLAQKAAPQTDSASQPETVPHNVPTPESTSEPTPEPIHDAQTSERTAAPPERGDVADTDDDMDRLEKEVKRRAGMTIRGADLLAQYQQKHPSRNENGTPLFEQPIHIASAVNAFDHETTRRDDKGIMKKIGRVFKKFAVGFLTTMTMLHGAATADARMVPHLAQRAKKSVQQKMMPERVTTAEQRGGVTLRPVREGDTLSELVREELQKQGFLTGVEDGPPVAQFVDKVLTEENRRLGGQWTKAGIGSGDKDRIAIEETITLQTLADRRFLTQWNEKLRTDGGRMAQDAQGSVAQSAQERMSTPPRNFAEAVVPAQQPATTEKTTPAQQQPAPSSRAQEPAVSYGAPSAYSVGRQTITIDDTRVQETTRNAQRETARTVDAKQAELGRKIREVAADLLGPERSHARPHQTIGQIIADSADAKATKQLFDRVSAATGITYDPEQTRLNVFVLRMIRAEKTAAGVRAARQPEAVAPQQLQTQQTAEAVGSSSRDTEEQRNVNVENNVAFRHFEQRFHEQYRNRSLTETQAYDDFRANAGDEAYSDYMLREGVTPKTQSAWETHVEQLAESFHKRAEQEIRARERQAVQDGGAEAQRREKQATYLNELTRMAMQDPHFPQLLEANRQLQDLLFKYAARLQQVMDPRDFADLTEGSPHVNQWIAKEHGPLTQEELVKVTVEGLPHMREVISSYNTQRSPQIPQDVLETHDANIARQAAMTAEARTVQWGEEIQKRTTIIKAVIQEVEKVIAHQLTN